MEKRHSAWIGIMLILFGGFFLIMKFFPEVKQLTRSASVLSIGLLITGLALTVSGLLRKHPRAVFGIFLIQVSAVLIFQSAIAGHWSWRPWLLIPAFLGVGTLISDLNQGAGLRKAWRESAILILIGTILFMLFSLKGIIHFLFPAALIITGAILIFGKKRPS